MKWLLLWFIWNLFIFLLYGWDKRKAKKGAWRISEKTLLLCAFCMGGIGAGVGMCLFHHKTKHLKFCLLVPAAIVFNVCVPALWYQYLH